MAAREALGAFQRRLADRLQSAPTDAGGLRASWLAVEAGGQRYLLPLAQAGEIFPVEGVQAVPYTQPWFLGVASLRGGLYGVVDLAGFLDGRSTSHPMQGPGAEPGGDSRLIVLNASLEVQCAVRVDRLMGLRSLDAFSASTHPAQTGPDAFGSCHVDAAGLHWQEINLVALSMQPQFLFVAA